MTQGVGGSTAEQELAPLVDWTGGVEAITLHERVRSRVVHATGVLVRCAIRSVRLNMCL